MELYMLLTRFDLVINRSNLVIWKTVAIRTLRWLDYLWNKKIVDKLLKTDRDRLDVKVHRKDKCHQFLQYFILYQL